MKTALGFENKETICTEEAHSVKELIAGLIALIEAFVERTTKDSDIVYVENGEENHVTCRLIENTLTDGSKVYDVRVS